MRAQRRELGVGLSPQEEATRAEARRTALHVAMNPREEESSAYTGSLSGGCAPLATRAESCGSWSTTWQRTSSFARDGASACTAWLGKCVVLLNGSHRRCRLLHSGACIIGPSVSSVFGQQLPNAAHTMPTGCTAAFTLMVPCTAAVRDGSLNIPCSAIWNLARCMFPTCLWNDLSAVILQVILATERLDNLFGGIIPDRLSTLPLGVLS